MVKLVAGEDKKTKTIEIILIASQRLHNRRVECWKVVGRDDYLLRYKRLGNRKSGEPRVVVTDVFLSSEALNATRDVIALVVLRPRLIKQDAIRYSCV